LTVMLIWKLLGYKRQKLKFTMTCKYDYHTSKTAKIKKDDITLQHITRMSL